MKTGRISCDDDAFWRWARLLEFFGDIRDSSLLRLLLLAAVRLLADHTAFVDVAASGCCSQKAV